MAAFFLLTGAGAGAIWVNRYGGMTMAQLVEELEKRDKGALCMPRKRAPTRCGQRSRRIRERLLRSEPWPTRARRRLDDKPKGPLSTKEKRKLLKQKEAAAKEKREKEDVRAAVGWRAEPFSAASLPRTPLPPHCHPTTLRLPRR